MLRTRQVGFENKRCVQVSSCRRTINLEAVVRPTQPLWLSKQTKRGRETDNQPVALGLAADGDGGQVACHECSVG